MRVLYSNKTKAVVYFSRKNENYIFLSEHASNDELSIIFAVLAISWEVDVAQYLIVIT